VSLSTTTPILGVAVFVGVGSQGFGGREPPEVHTTEEARGVGGGSPLQ
jgi:hypothetical protein